uniref:zinc finger protein 280D-like isoform X2 n=1 Tax=Pristiophorus japonicus TaxID=55135 RepID=UPI00398E4500
MAELFMECEEEELEPWQKGNKDDEDDDDEPIFVGEITSSKTSSCLSNKAGGTTFNLTQQGGIQNGGLSRGMMVSFSSGASSTIPSVNQQSVTSAPSNSSTMAVYQSGSRTMPASLTTQPMGFVLKDMGSPATVSQSYNVRQNPSLTHYQSRPTVPVISGVTSQLGRTGLPQLRPVATARAIPNISYNPTQVNSSVPNVSTSSSGQKLLQGISPKPLQTTQILNHTSGIASAAQSTNVTSKRSAICETNSIASKKSKTIEVGSGSSPSILSPSSTGCSAVMSSYNSASKGSQSNIKNGVPVPRACPKCNIHFNVLDSLRQHMVFCCPDLVSSYCPVLSTEQSSNKVFEIEKGKLIMLVNDFYYGKDDGDAHLNQQDQKTHTTFKCYSCLKILKNNIRFMNHMKHHMELEKQSSESWENHTTCQHCHRQFPTPFQLQCHIETAHSPYESTTICKICELSYESEQVLLQHMKDNHKPGEMPYVCQICNYRSSVYSDVDNHFRIIHENTKQLLCPFCLKVIKSGNAYVQHYMRHQKKGVYRCSKCKLQFLTCKEKVDHKTQHHRTFRKPMQLEGLPPGTKVTIRASMTPYQVGSSSMPSINTATSTTLQCSSSVTVNSKLYSSTINQVNTEGRSLPAPYFKQQEKKESPANKKITKSFNIVLQSFRTGCGLHKCIECDTEIKEFASHFSTYVRCSLCRFRSSCSKSYAAHMMSFHTVPSKMKFWMFREYSNKLRGIKLVCASCPFEADVTDSDDMAKHLDRNKFHGCRIVSKSSASCTIENMFKGSEDISTADEMEKSEEKTSSILPDAESLEIDLSSDGSLEKTDQLLKAEVEWPSVEDVPSPNCDKLKDHQDKISSNESIESTLKTTDGLPPELTTEKEGDTGETVQDDSSDREPVTPNTAQEQGFNSADNDAEIIHDEFEENAACNETKDCETLEDTMQKCKQTEDEGLDEEKCTQDKGDDANVEQDKDPKEDVSFEQFFRSKDEPEAVGSDVSEQGSIQLEPLTPSEVLEHEATEILQKGSVVTSTKKKGTTASEYIEENTKETSSGAILMSSEHLEESEKS